MLLIMRTYWNKLILPAIVAVTPMLMSVARADERPPLVPITTSLSSTVLSGEVQLGELSRSHNPFDQPFLSIGDRGFDFRLGDGRFGRQGAGGNLLSSTSSSLTGASVNNTEISASAPIANAPVEVQLILQPQSPPNYSSGSSASLDLLSEAGSITFAAPASDAFQGTTTDPSSPDVLAPGPSSQIGVEPVPEPSTLALAGLAGVLSFARITRKA